MTDNPRVKKAPIPSEELNDLLVWIIKPMKELEKKFDEEVKKLNDSVKNCQSELATVRSEVPSLEKEFEKLVAIPAKNGLRISAIESKLKHYDETVKGVQKNKFDLEKVKQDIGVNVDEIQMMSDDINSISSHIISLKKEVGDLHTFRRNQLDSLEALKSQVKQVSCDLKKLCMKYENSKDEDSKQREYLRVDLKDQIEKALIKVDNINDHVELYRNQLNKADKDNAIAAMNSVESLKKNLVEDFAARILKLEEFVKGEDERFSNLKYEMDLVEKRCDKLGTLVKEVKASTGV